MTNQLGEERSLSLNDGPILERQTDGLSAGVLEKFAAQIEYLHSFDDLGEFHFQSYRNAKVLAIGSGRFLASLAAALFESGLSNFHVLFTSSEPADRQKLAEVVERARLTDPKSTVYEEIAYQKEEQNFWREAVQPFQSILYVSHGDEMEELRALHRICKEEKKMLLPAIFVLQAGLAGPLVQPGSAGCWESAWRRIHRPALGNSAEVSFSSTAEMLLANVIAFELLKTVTGVTKPELENKIFLLDLDTLEGDAYSFMPHPLVTGVASAEWVQDIPQQLEMDSSSSEQSELLDYFRQLTSAHSGIFHTWEEGDLKQLPLSQCQVQPADPLSEGPAELLPDIVSIALTHEEARREAGLAGIEAYVSRMARRLITTLPSDLELVVGKKDALDYIGVGAGETFAEGVCRGLQKCLNEELRKRGENKLPIVQQVQFDTLENDHLRYYLHALTTMQGTPIIGLDEEIFGFPVVWVESGGQWYGSTGLNKKLALQKSLEKALQHTQNKTVPLMRHGIKMSNVNETDQALISLAGEEMTHSEVLKIALQILEYNLKRLLVFDLVLEPFIKGEPAEVFGVLLRDEVCR